MELTLKCGFEKNYLVKVFFSHINVYLLAIFNFRKFFNISIENIALASSRFLIEAELMGNPS